MIIARTFAAALALGFMAVALADDAPVAQTATEFCADYESKCAAQADNFDNTAACETWYGAAADGVLAGSDTVYSNTKACYQQHLSVSNDAAAQATHCPHARGTAKCVAPPAPVAQTDAAKAFSDLFDDDYGWWQSEYDGYTDEHKAVMVIGGECGNYQLASSDDDGDDESYEDPYRTSCDDGVDGCSMQLIKMPKTMATMKAIGFQELDDDYAGDDWTEDAFDAMIAKGGYKFCLPDDFQKRAAAAGWSLDHSFSKNSACNNHGGDPKACVAAGCGSEPNDDDEGHYCYGHSHHGLTSNSAAKEAAVKQAEKNAADAQEIVVTLQKAKTAACATTVKQLLNFSPECKDAEKSLEDALVTLNTAQSALDAAENYDLSSATGVTVSLVVVMLSAIATFF